MPLGYRPLAGAPLASRPEPPAGGGAVSGSLAATEGADVALFAGTVTSAAVTGTLAATEGADRASFTGTVTVATAVTGTLAATEGADAALFAGTVANPVTGTLAATEGADRALFVGIGGLTAAGLAELYGGGLFGDRKKKREEEEKEPTLEIMVRALSREPEGKRAVIRALPKKVQQFFPDPQIAIVANLVKRIEAASQPVKKEIERLYRARVEDEEEDDIFILLL